MARYKPLQEARSEHNALVKEIENWMEGPRIEAMKARVREKVKATPELASRFQTYHSCDRTWARNWDWVVKHEKVFENEKRLLQSKKMEPGPEEEALFSQIRDVEEKISGLLHRKRCDERDNREAVEDHERALKRYAEGVIERERSREVIRILRGEIQGAISPRDAGNLGEHIHTYGIDPRAKSCDYNSPTLPDDLRRLLDDPEWRVIRVGGGLHWVAWVRNPDGRTVDVIDDNKYNGRRAPRRTIEEIHREWSNPGKWRDIQLYFY